MTVRTKYSHTNFKGLPIIRNLFNGGLKKLNVNTLTTACQHNFTHGYLKHKRCQHCQHCQLYMS